MVNSVKNVLEKLPSTQETLINSIVGSLNRELSPDLCTKLADSMSRRIAEVIKAKGGHAKY